MATAREIIRRSLRLVEAIGAGDTIDGDIKETGAFAALNDMLSFWAAEKFLVPYLTTDTLTLVAGTNTYTIAASGATFTTARPIRIINAFIRDSSNNDYPVKVISISEYDGIAYKPNTGRPEYLLYLPENPLGKIKLYPTPDAAESLIIDSWKHLAQIALVTDSLVLPPEYTRAVVYNLAADLAPEYGVLKPDLIKHADLSRKIIKTVNVGVVPQSTFDIGLVGGIRRKDDIFSGG